MPRLAVLLATLLLACYLATACQSGVAQVEPGLEFTTVPPAQHGGPDKLAPVAGRVRGARPNQRVVLFARSAGSWWVQPFRSRPLTTIERDSTWKNTTHLGTDYAALLVEPGYRPPVVTESLPPRGGAVVAVAITKGSGTWVPPALKTLTFSGYDWQIVQVPVDKHGVNDCDARNVWVDGEGHLHLLLAQRDGRWSGARVTLTRALGYGTYLFSVRDTSQLDPASALVMYTWDDRADENRRELNISIGNWGDPRSKNAQYVLQHEDVAANVFRFSAPSGPLTHSFRWEPDNALFTTVRGTDPASSSLRVAQRQFTAGVPAPATATVNICLLYAHESQSPPTKDVEAVVEKFVYLP
jgi:hypothetical protein